MNEFDYELEAILAEFGSDSSPRPQPAPVSRPDSVSKPSSGSISAQPKVGDGEYRAPPNRAALSSASEHSNIRGKADDNRSFADNFRPMYTDELERADKKTRFSRRGDKKSDRRRRAGDGSRRAERNSAPPLNSPRCQSRAPRALLSIVLALASLLCLSWSIRNINPTAGTVAPQAAQKSADIVSDLEAYVASLSAASIEEEAKKPERIIYTIPEEALAAPAPNPACFGSVPTSEAARILDVIQTAEDSGLLEGQRMVFSPDVQFNEGSYYEDIKYYCDDSILAIAWKEIVNGNTISLCEVKVADASQFRRKLSGDSFGASIQDYCSNIARGANAVAAMNADYYAFRNQGMVIYNRQIYRFNESTYTGMYKQYNCLDTCFIDGSGNFLFMPKGTDISREDFEAYIADNDIIFSLAFGPILVKDGELDTSYFDGWYPSGEINTRYSRAGIAQVDTLHYLYINVNHSDEAAARWTVRQLAEEFLRRGVLHAYNLDGGQTSELVFDGVPYNYIDFGTERVVSDIIYFATAIPEPEVTG